MRHTGAPNNAWSGMRRALEVSAPTGVMATRSLCVPSHLSLWPVGAATLAKSEKQKS